MPTFHNGYLLVHFHSIFFEVMVPLMLEEEDHQLGGGGVEAEEEVFQGFCFAQCVEMTTAWDV